MNRSGYWMEMEAGTPHLVTLRLHHSLSDHMGVDQMTLFPIGELKSSKHQILV